MVLTSILFAPLIFLPLHSLYRVWMTPFKMYLSIIVLIPFLVLSTSYLHHAKYIFRAKSRQMALGNWTRRPPKISHVIGGENCYNDHRYYTSIQLYGLHRRRYLHHCGGIFIHRHWILTSGTCCASTSISNIRIALGQNKTNSLKYVDLYKTIKKRVIHPQFAIGRNDICLIFSSIKFEESLNIASIGYSRHENISVAEFCDGDGVIMGFGLQNRMDISKNILGEQKLYNFHLQCARMQVQRECPKNGNAGHKHFCATGDNGNRGPCFKDHGGPFVCKGVVVGLIEATKSCGDHNKTTYFTNLAAYDGFIRKTLMSGFGRIFLTVHYFLLIFLVIFI